MSVNNQINKNVFAIVFGKIKEIITNWKLCHTRGSLPCLPMPYSTASTVFPEWCYLILWISVRLLNIGRWYYLCICRPSSVCVCLKKDWLICSPALSLLLISDILNAGPSCWWWWWWSPKGNLSSQFCGADWYMWNRWHGYRCKWLIVSTSFLSLTSYS